MDAQGLTWKGRLKGRLRAVVSPVRKIFGAPSLF
jgi:hypothetical protein